MSSPIAGTAWSVVVWTGGVQSGETSGAVIDTATFGHSGMRATVAITSGLIFDSVEITLHGDSTVTAGSHTWSVEGHTVASDGSTRAAEGEVHSTFEASGAIVVSPAASSPQASTTITVNAGPDKALGLTPGSEVTLSGSATITGGSGDTTYAWTRVRRDLSFGGDALEGTNTATLTVTNVSIEENFRAEGRTTAADFVYRLTVTNNGVSASDDVTVTVQPPAATVVTADAGDDFEVNSEEDYIFTASWRVENPSGATTYTWVRQSGTAGGVSGSVGTGTISNGRVSTTFSANAVTEDQTVVYRFTVTNNGVSHSDDITITVKYVRPSGNLVFGMGRSDIAILDRYVDPDEAELHLQNRVDEFVSGLLSLWHHEDYRGNKTLDEKRTESTLTHSGHTWQATGLGDPGMAGTPMPLHLHGRQLPLELCDYLHSIYRYSDNPATINLPRQTIVARTRGADLSNPQGYGDDGGVVQNFRSDGTVSAISDPGTVHEYDDGLPMDKLLGIVEDRTGVLFDKEYLARTAANNPAYSGTAKQSEIPTSLAIIRELLVGSGWGIGFHSNGTLMVAPLIPPILDGAPVDVALECTGGVVGSEGETTGPVVLKNVTAGSSFTMMAWVRIDGLATDDMVVNDSEPHSGAEIMRCPGGTLAWHRDTTRSDTPDQHLSFTVDGRDALSTNVPEVGKWHQLTCVWTGTKATIYVDGENVAESTLSAINPSSGEFRFGGHIGGISNVRYWVQALSEEQINDMGEPFEAIDPEPLLDFKLENRYGWYTESRVNNEQAAILCCRWAPALTLDLARAPGDSVVTGLREVVRRNVFLKSQLAELQLQPQDLATGLGGERRADMLRPYFENRIHSQEAETSIEANSALSRTADALSHANLIARRSHVERWTCRVELGQRALGLRHGDEVMFTGHSDRFTDLWPRPMRVMSSRIIGLTARGPRMDLVLWG